MNHCKSKKRYFSAETAQHVADSINEKTKNRKSRHYRSVKQLNIFHCPTCGFYHLTSAQYRAQREEKRK
jgi:hypothetical protein